MGRRISAVFRGKTLRDQLQRIHTLESLLQVQFHTSSSQFPVPVPDFMGLKNSATAAAALRPPPLCYLTFSIFFFFFFFSICALLTTITTTRTTCFGVECSLNAEGDLYLQRTHVGTSSTNKGEQKKMGSQMMNRGRRHLSGPGSSPPRCTSKCGKCRPCKPVHVAVPPGTPVTAEYYPEAWRCKCGNKLYMP